MHSHWPRRRLDRLTETGYRVRHREVSISDWGEKDRQERHRRSVSFEPNRGLGDAFGMHLIVWAIRGNDLRARPPAAIACDRAFRGPQNVVEVG